MICWVMYDIKNDRVRSKVAKICLQSGLLRVQYSVFLGKIENTERDSLRLQIEDLVDEENDSVYIFPMNKEELRDTCLIGQAFDKKMVTDEVKSLFL